MKKIRLINNFLFSDDRTQHAWTSHIIFELPDMHIFVTNEDTYL